MNNVLFQIVSKGAEYVRSRKWLCRMVYDPLDTVLRRHLYDTNYVLQDALKHKNVKVTPPPVSEYDSDRPWTVGIIRDLFHNHESYIMACRDLRVAYKTVDLFASDWMRQVQESGCDAFVAWPSEYIQEWKRVYDDRLRFLVRELGRVVYPSYDALWLYGSKQRMLDWLEIHGYPHPRSWAFYLREEAESFLTSTLYPVVVKLDIGSSSHSVWIAKNKCEAGALVKRAFGKGLIGKRADPQARQWRHILIQEYIPDIREWRMIRIGDSYFGHEKKRAGEFHSGSKLVGWFAPPPQALELLHSVTEKGGFGSMDMDVFETSDGRFLVNELQAVFGSFDSSQMYIDGAPGRYRRVDGRFVFEGGRFCWNACCNLRIEDLLGRLDSRRP